MHPVQLFTCLKVFPGHLDFLWRFLLHMFLELIYVSIYHHYIIKSFLVHTYILLVDSHLGCFCFCGIMNNCVVNIIKVLVWLCIFMFHEYIFRNYWTMWYMFLFWFWYTETFSRIAKLFSKASGLSPQECAVFSHPHAD